MQKYVLTELDSGERVISERVPSVRSVSVGFWIGAGSRDERDDRAGVSHFIEHLLFKGSGEYTALEIAELFDEMGGELNAATSREHTVVYARIPDVHAEKALDVMSDMVFSPLFEELDAELVRNTLIRMLSGPGRRPESVAWEPPTMRAAPRAGSAMRRWIEWPSMLSGAALLGLGLAIGRMIWG